jgi:glycosyltransferase involved in cell wall biosynthesis
MTARTETQVPVRVLQVINLGFEAGGAEKIVRITRDRLQEMGHEVYVLSTDMNSAGQEIFANSTVPAISGSAPERLTKYFWNRQAYQTMRSIVRSFNPDLVHFHTIGEFSPSVLWAIGRKPAVLSIHGPEEFTLQLLPWALPRSDYSSGSYRREDRRLVGWLRYGYLRYLQRPAYLLALRRVLVVTAPSRFMARVIAGDFPRTPVKVLYPGTIRPQEPLPSRSQQPTVLFVGRLEPVKGVEHLLRAFAHVSRHHPEARLRIVGEGSQRDALTDLAQMSGVANVVEFTGWLTGDDLRQEYADATVLVIPSVWPEALGLVGVEALANGCPVIGSSNGAIPEFVDPGVTGAVAEPGDELGLARAMESFLVGQSKRAEAAQAAAIKIRTFYVDAFIGNLLELYQQVLEAPSKSPGQVVAHDSHGIAGNDGTGRDV